MSQPEEPAVSARPGEVVFTPEQLESLHTRRVGDLTVAELRSIIREEVLGQKPAAHLERIAGLYE